jgi:hypothetical protein
MPAEDRIEEVKDGLAGLWAPGGEPIGDLARVLTYEPTSAPALPLLTMQTAGFNRASLASAQVQPPITDPLQGRTWVWRFDVRLWVALVGDAEAAQKSMDRLIPQVVTALEADKSLAGIADDAAISTGDTAVVRPRQGQPVLVTSCRCAVETTEPLT